jgi:hypothetical protein
MSTFQLNQQILERSRAVTGNADFLSAAVASQDRDQVGDAFDDLLASYDQYAGRAASYSSRLGFDEVAKLDSLEERDQSAANALGSALLDLDMALLLSQAAQAAGEMEGETSSSEIDESVTRLTQTVDAFQGAADVSGIARLAFDEVTAATAEAAPSSPDLPTAKAAFNGKTTDVYEKLLSESASLLTDMFKQLSGLDNKQIKEGLDAVKGTIDIPAVGRAVPRILDALQRAIRTVKDLIGEEGFKKIDEEITTMVEAIKKGEGPAQLFLKHSYQTDKGQQTIAGWVAASQSDVKAIDTGVGRLANLEQQIVQTFTVSRKIVASLKLLSQPIKWILTRFGGTAPVDLILAGIYFLVADAALLRGMDYADTTTLVKFVDGTLTISKQTLGIPD